MYVLPKYTNISLLIMYIFYGNNNNRRNQPKLSIQVDIYTNIHMHKRVSIYTHIEAHTMYIRYTKAEIKRMN